MSKVLFILTLKLFSIVTNSSKLPEAISRCELTCLYTTANPFSL